MCKEFGALPCPGGLFDQPFKLVLGMSMVLEAVQEKSDKDANQPKPKIGTR